MGFFVSMSPRVNTCSRYSWASFLYRPSVKSFVNTRPRYCCTYILRNYCETVHKKVRSSVIISKFNRFVYLKRIKSSNIKITGSEIFKNKSSLSQHIITNIFCWSLYGIIAYIKNRFIKNINFIYLFN